MAKRLSFICFLASMVLITISLPRLREPSGMLMAAGGLGALISSWGFWRMSKKRE